MENKTLAIKKALTIILYIHGEEKLFDFEFPDDLRYRVLYEI